MAFFDLVAGMRLIIYGYSTRSPYPEDRHAEEQAWETYRMFPAVSFSVAATGGEYGGVPLAEVAEITEEEFELARGRGWTDDDNEMGGTR